MGIGLILLAGALMLTVYNIWDEHRADRVTQTVLASLEHQMIPSEAEENTPTQSLAPSEIVPSDSQVDAETSDHLPAVVTALPSPALEQTSYPETMPTIEIDGNLYIGILEIPPLALSHGGENFYDGWMKNPKSAMISCNDGFRPVSFLVEALEEDAD